MALAEEAAKVIGIHGIGAGKPPVKPEVWEEFRARPETEQQSLSIENRFYSGFSNSEIDWAKPVHAIVLDFKGDSMQLGHILQHLSDAGEQYVFIGNPLPFNGGWHFSAVNDFEHPKEQSRLSPDWKNIRIWHRVNFVPTVTEAGEAALTPRESFNPENKTEGAVPVSDSRKFATIFLVGGLMPHTLNATLMDGANSPGALFLSKHMELGANFATIGHGLDVFIALGTQERSAIAKFSVAIWPGQDQLLSISDIRAGEGSEQLAADENGRTIVCKYKYKEGAAGGEFISASYWGIGTKETFLSNLGFAKDAMAAASTGPDRLHVLASTETVLSLDISKLPGISGGTFVGEPSAPNVAIFLDDVADPIEAYGMMEHLISQKWNFQMISHSWPSIPPKEEEAVDIRRVATETVFGNAMYGLKDCRCIIPTTPANLVASGTKFDGFFVAGGQCPYHMMKDEYITAIMDSCPVAAAVCHGPEAMIGSKWLHGPDGPVGSFITYYGAWLSFRDVMHKYERKKPGEICQDASGRLFTGNAPNATKPMVVAACAAIEAARL